MTRLLLLVLILSLAVGSGPASAQGANDLDARIAELELRKIQINDPGPLAWTIAGGGMTGAGLLIGLVGIIGCLGSSQAGGGCSPEHGIGLGISAGVLTIAGVAILVPNSRKLREQKAELQGLDREIQTLRSQQDQAAFSRIRIGVNLESRSLTLGWVY